MNCSPYKISSKRKIILYLRRKPFSSLPLTSKLLSLFKVLKCYILYVKTFLHAVTSKTIKSPVFTIKNYRVQKNTFIIFVICNMCIDCLCMCFFLLFLMRYIYFKFTLFISFSMTSILQHYYSFLL